jgi:hypothetical protein
MATDRRAAGEVLDRIFSALDRMFHLDHRAHLLNPEQIASGRVLARTRKIPDGISRQEDPS